MYGFITFFEKTSVFFFKNNLLLTYTNYRNFGWLLLNPVFFNSDASGFFKKSKLYLFLYNYYQPTNQTTLVVVRNNPSVLVSDNWVFRELSEFFGCDFSGLSDSRCLLLDYTFKHNPLKKNFPVVGFKEFFFENHSGTVSFTNINHVEL